MRTRRPPRETSATIERSVAHAHLGLAPRIRDFSGVTLAQLAEVGGDDDVAHVRIASLWTHESVRWVGKGRRLGFVDEGGPL